MFPAIRRRAAGACLTLLVAAAVLSPGARAQQPAPRDGISQDQAVALVRSQTNGKVVRVERRAEGDGVVYRVRVLTPDGRLREYRVDAATGTIR